jgi:pimeloyl-ACP methyl ester carboxylesterase
MDFERVHGAAPQKANIVLAHGVWSDGSAWRDVIPALVHAGHSVYAAQLPLTSFDGDVAALERLLDHVVGPVVLVGHSYGGAVISAAGDHEKVKQLVYLCAFAPLPDEAFGSLLGVHPPAAQVDAGPDQHGFVWATPALFADAIGHDLSRSVINLAVTVQKPYAHKLFAATLPNPAWKRKPSAYLIATEDRILNPRTQHMLADRIGATCREIASSHLVIASHPAETAEFILEAAAGI